MDQQWRKRIEAAQYEAEKASRRYYQVEPENRLVARTLEEEWNARLEELELIKEQYGEIQAKPPFALSEEQRQRILALASDLPRLWRASTTRNSQRKEVVRVLIEDVTLRNVDEPWSTDVWIRWKSGAVSRHRAERVKPYFWTTAPEAVSRIVELMKDNTDAQVAEILNSEGYRTGRGDLFTAERVEAIRHHRGLKKGESPPRGSTTIH